MKIAIIVAMGKELVLLLPHLRDSQEIRDNGVTYHQGTMGQHTVAVMQCGIGKVNAAVRALELIQAFCPDLVINTGVAGGTGAAGILDVVVGTEVAYHDVWCGPETFEGQAAECPARFAGAQSVIDILPQLTRPVRAGLIASGDVFVADRAVTDRILSLYPQALAVDMESAAIAHVCHLKGVPFCAIRVVSDTPGEADNISQYENFWSDAPQQTFETLNQIISLL